MTNVGFKANEMKMHLTFKFNIVGPERATKIESISEIIDIQWLEERESQCSVVSDLGWQWMNKWNDTWNECFAVHRISNKYVKLQEYVPSSLNKKKRCKGRI